MPAAAIQVAPSKQAIQALVPSSAPAIKSQAYQIMLQTVLAAAAAGAGVLAVTAPGLATELMVFVPPYLGPVILGIISVLARQLASYSQKHTVNAVNTALNTDATIDMRYGGPQ